jgi:hypothetical protein
MTPRLLAVNSTVLCAMWNYREININVTEQPYFGAVMVPWKV